MSVFSRFVFFFLLRRSSSSSRRRRRDVGGGGGRRRPLRRRLSLSFSPSLSLFLSSSISIKYDSATEDSDENKISFSACPIQFFPPLRSFLYFTSLLLLAPALPLARAILDPTSTHDRIRRESERKLISTTTNEENTERASEKERERESKRNYLCFVC